MRQNPSKRLTRDPAWSIPPTRPTGTKLRAHTGALLDRLTHRVHILEMNAESHRLKQSRQAEAVRAASGK